MFDTKHRQNYGYIYAKMVYKNKLINFENKKYFEVAGYRIVYL